MQLLRPLIFWRATMLTLPASMTKIVPVQEMQIFQYSKSFCNIFFLYILTNVLDGFYYSKFPPKKNVFAYCPYLYILENSVSFFWFLNAIGNQGFTFTLPALWLWINKICSYYPFPLKWTGSKETVISKHFKWTQQQVHLMIKPLMIIFTLRKTDRAVFHCSLLCAATLLFLQLD